MTFPVQDGKTSREEGTRPPGAHFAQLRALPGTHMISSRAGQRTKLAVRGLAVWLSISHDTRLEMETEKGMGGRYVSQGHPKPSGPLPTLQSQQEEAEWPASGAGWES